jgi:hypothetical protein
MAGDERRATAQLRTIPRRPERHGLSWARVIKFNDGMPLPLAQQSSDPFTQESGREGPAVVEHGIDVMPAQKRGQMTRDGGVCGVGQTEFAQAAGGFLRVCVDSAGGEKTVDNEFSDFLWVQRERARAPPKSAARKDDANSVRSGVGCIAGENGLFGVAGGGNQPRPSTGVRRHAQRAFKVMGERGINVVPSQQKVLTDRDAFELRQPGRVIGPDETRSKKTEIGGASTEIANQQVKRTGRCYLLARDGGREVFQPTIEPCGAAVTREPIVKNGLRFFE